MFLVHRIVHRSEDKTFQLAKDKAEKVVKDIRRATRKQYSSEEKIRIVLEGLRDPMPSLRASTTSTPSCSTS